MSHLWVGSGSELLIHFRITQTNSDLSGSGSTALLERGGGPPEELQFFSGENNSEAAEAHAAQGGQVESGK